VAGICGYGEGLSGSINAGNFLTSYKVYWLASQEGLCSPKRKKVSNVVCLYCSISLEHTLKNGKYMVNI
jgi:hypothetical protein